GVQLRGIEGFARRGLACVRPRGEVGLQRVEQAARERVVLVGLLHDGAEQAVENLARENVRHWAATTIGLLMILSVVSVGALTYCGAVRNLEAKVPCWSR